MFQFMRLIDSVLSGRFFVTLVALLLLACAGFCYRQHKNREADFTTLEKAYAKLTQDLKVAEDTVSLKQSVIDGYKPVIEIKEVPIYVPKQKGMKTDLYVRGLVESKPAEPTITQVCDITPENLGGDCTVTVLGNTAGRSVKVDWSGWLDLGSRKITRGPLPAQVIDMPLTEIIKDCPDPVLLPPVKRSHLNLNAFGTFGHYDGWGLSGSFITKKHFGPYLGYQRLNSRNVYSAGISLSVPF